MTEEEQRQRFGEIIEQHKGIFFKVARAYCQADEDRQDLMQEMMLQVWRSINKYKEQFKISTFLYRIALNVAISFYRKTAVRKAKYVAFDEQISQIQETNCPDKDERLSLLEQFISELKEMDKALMFLYLEDKTHSEIAEILGMSVTNVGTKVGRIKDKLKQRFSKLKSS